MRIVLPKSKGPWVAAEIGVQDADKVVTSIPSLWLKPFWKTNARLRP